MNDLLLLVKCITLLYRESLLKDKDNSTKDIVRSVLSNIKSVETFLGVTKDQEILTSLKNTTLEMVNYEDDHVYNKHDLLQQLKINCSTDENTYDSLANAINDELSEEDNKKLIINIRKALNNNFKTKKIEEILNIKANEFKFKRDKIKNVGKWLTELISELEPYQSDSKEKDPSIIDEINIMNDKEGMERIYGSVKEENLGTNGFICGFQDVNKMVGGKFRLGELWTLNGLQHNYKTGFSLTLFKQFCLYNTPVLRDPTKKPLLLRISFEDSLASNFHYLYKNLWENETGQVLKDKDLEEIDIKVISEYVKTRLTATGFHVAMLHVNPTDWTFRDIFNTVLKYESEGYEVQLLMVDYLTKISKVGCTQGASGQDVRNLYERIKGFIAAKNILFITPHQLSTQVKDLVRDGYNDLVKRLPGGGWTADSKQIDQIVDGELFFHIETVKGKEELNGSYFTLQRGKLRRINQVDENDLFRVYKFVKKGVIPDDLDKPNSAMMKVGGLPLSQETEDDKWDRFD